MNSFLTAVAIGGALPLLWGFFFCIGWKMCERIIDLFKYVSGGGK